MVSHPGICNIKKSVPLLGLETVSPEPAGAGGLQEVLPQKVVTAQLQCQRLRAQTQGEGEAMYIFLT